MNLLRKLFGKDPKEIFLSLDPVMSSWRTVTWNFDLKEPGTRKWMLELVGKETFLVQWTRGDKEEINFFQGGVLIRKRRVPPQNYELKSLMNLALHSTIKFSLEENHEHLLTPVSGATTQDMQVEARSLEWLKASFGSLSRALDGVAKDPSLILTAALFAGIEPETNDRVLRLICFNLDVFFYLRSDHSLQIVIFDDKNLGHGTSRSPTFQQIIKVTKPQFYDEMVKLVHKVATVGELN